MEINKEFKEIAKPAGYLITKQPYGSDWLENLAVTFLKEGKCVLFVTHHMSSKRLRLKNILTKLYPTKNIDEVTKEYHHQTGKTDADIGGRLFVITEGYVPIATHVDALLVDNIELMKENYFYKYLRTTLLRKKGQVFVVYNWREKK